MTQRRIDVDVVRFLALVAMFIAHVAPVAGPGGVLMLSEFVTMPLFALLVGAGAQLGEWGAARSGKRARWWRSMVVRAVALVVVGMLIDRAGAQVLIVLMHLGALVVVTDLVARLRWWWPAALGVLTLLVSPILVTRFAEMQQEAILEASLSGAAWEPSLWWETQLFLWGNHPYRLLSMITYGCLGILLTRWWLRRSEVPRWHLLAGGMVGLGVAGAVFVLRAAGQVGLEAYSGTHVETVFNMGLITGVFGLGLWGAAFLPGVLARLLAATGAMTLTLYAAHVLWLAYYVRVLRPGTADDGWGNLTVLILGSLALTALWRVAVRRGAWRRGPLEGLIALLVR